MMGDDRYLQRLQALKYPEALAKNGRSQSVISTQFKWLSSSSSSPIQSFLHWFLHYCTPAMSIAFNFTPQELKKLDKQKQSGMYKTGSDLSKVLCKVSKEDENDIEFLKSKLLRLKDRVRQAKERKDSLLDIVERDGIVASPEMVEDTTFHQQYSIANFNQSFESVVLIDKSDDKKKVEQLQRDFESWKRGDNKKHYDELELERMQEANFYSKLSLLKSELGTISNDNEEPTEAQVVNSKVAELLEVRIPSLLKDISKLETFAVTDNIIDNKHQLSGSPLEYQRRETLLLSKKIEAVKEFCQHCLNLKGIVSQKYEKLESKHMLLKQCVKKLERYQERKAARQDEYLKLREASLALSSTAAFDTQRLASELQLERAKRIELNDLKSQLSLEREKLLEERMKSISDLCSIVFPTGKDAQLCPPEVTSRLEEASSCVKYVEKSVAISLNELMVMQKGR